MIKDEGILAGLRLWLVFLIVLVLIQTPVPIAIFLGGIAGFCWGIIVNWRLSKETPESWVERIERVVGNTPGKINLAEAHKRVRSKLKRPTGETNKDNGITLENIQFWRTKDK